MRPIKITARYSYKLPWLIVLLIGALWLSSGVFAASVYKCKGAKGNLIFSDKICPKDQQGQAMELNTPNVQQSYANKAKRNAKSSTSAKSAPAGSAIVSLLNGAEVVLKTTSMKSSRGMTWQMTNVLIMPNSVRVPYKKIQRLEITPTRDKQAVQLVLTMRDGAVDKQTISTPITKISGDTNIGKFNESLLKIRSIEFK